jgi:hypothetical protein
MKLKMAQPTATKVLALPSETDIMCTHTLSCTRAEFWHLLKDDPAMRLNFTQMILEFSHEAFRGGFGGGVFLEFPNLMGKESDPAVFQLISTSAFDAFSLQVGSPDAFRGTAFTNQARAARPDQPIISFPNISQDTWLVVPNEKFFARWAVACVHLVSFLKAFSAAEGTIDMIHQLWIAVAKHVMGFAELKDGAERLYVSTHGTGVPWLHIRLSDTPKYYSGTLHIEPEGGLDISLDTLD